MAVSASVAAGDSGADSKLVEQGRRIYQEGILPSGAELVGQRFDNITVEGKQAACMSCHRHSGMGAVEGDSLVSPITGNYLFHPERTNVATMDPRVGKRFSERHDPYTDQSLAETLRSGTNNRGRKMSVIMPHYKLDKAALAALISYLKQLSVEPSPGVTDDAIHFATVVAPGVAPERRKAMLDILQTAFRQKNGSTVVGTKRGGRRHMVTAAEMILGTERKWQLHEWALQGPSETWGEQLHQFQAKQPVFALISGIGNGTWQPVQDFCNQEKVPCWFPSVAEPPAEPSFYAVYYSRGIALEADALAEFLKEHATPKPKRLVQVFRDVAEGKGAAAAMAAALKESAIPVENRPLPAGSADALPQALANLQPEDVVMLWLRRSDIAALAAVAPPQGNPVYFSAILGGGEHAPFADAWKAKAQLVYPYELPDKRLLYVRTFQSWMNMQKLAIVDEPLQAEVFFAVRFLTDTTSEMLDNLFNDYLLDRLENMLSKSEGLKAEQQSRDVASLGAEGELARRYPKARPLAETVNLPAGMVSVGAKGTLQSTTLYPRLSLGIGQRFASKGAYVVRFGTDGKLLAESELIVP